MQIAAGVRVFVACVGHATHAPSPQHTGHIGLINGRDSIEPAHEQRNRVRRAEHVVVRVRVANGADGVPCRPRGPHSRYYISDGGWLHYLPHAARVHVLVVANDVLVLCGARVERRLFASGWHRQRARAKLAVAVVRARGNFRTHRRPAVGYARHKERYKQQSAPGTRHG